MVFCEIGDWVQATEVITESDFMGQKRWVHARKGGIGHVISVSEDPNWVDVFFERTGTTSICHTSEIKRLGNAQTGRFIFL